MAAWEQIPCLIALRNEFNAVNPARDKGADGSIGDSSHTSSSDHTPDEDSDVLRGRDADTDNETHALDIDSTGPWPGDNGRAGNRAGGWFDLTIRAIAAREREEYLSADVYGRLEYIIWRGQIITRSSGWFGWRTYTGPSAHYDHAHFSARYLTRTEADTRPWGVEEDVAIDRTDVVKVWTEDNIVAAPSNAPSAAENTHWGPGYFLTDGAFYHRANNALLTQILGKLNGDLVDEQQIVTGVLAGLDPQAIVAAIVAALPPELARQVADELAARLAS
jgi:hypothetical protein